MNDSCSRWMSCFRFIVRSDIFLRCSLNLISSYCWNRGLDFQISSADIFSIEQKVVEFICKEKSKAYALLTFLALVYHGSTTNLFPPSVPPLNGPVLFKKCTSKRLIFSLKRFGLYLFPAKFRSKAGNLTLSKLVIVYCPMWRWMSESSFFNSAIIRCFAVLEPQGVGGRF